MSYSTCPGRTGLPLIVLRWLQSLDLTFSPRNFRRDFSNGYLIAEIFSRYFPEDIHMHSFVNGTSLSIKLSNWAMLEKFFTKRNLKPVRELIDGTIHCKPGAAEIFVQDIYTMLTNSRIKHIQDEQIDFTDRMYQDNLPLVARSTASRAIKNNIGLTEIMAEPDIYKNEQKINAILDIHRQRRLIEREQHPSRFGIKPTPRQLAIDHSSILVRSFGTTRLPKEKSIPALNNVPSTKIRGKTDVHFKTIQVKQPEKFAFDVNMNTEVSSTHFKELQKRNLEIQKKIYNQI
ncbi:PREDICTED: spermatogenesis-associated protein 4 [Thamnophis sirtalis]|uniref:Spermatogenesis-associated protein 4 n=1 Tax=Thamnophis sirtalis TaxID=35019 RepID=A0A6I9Y1S5_9SAUR|nr:PREDICTED: spermatogenesis-associated protein 4 [Thamnophis sirtalis]XP_013910741.1 PREDICTED: spermatogenesis-associated protein 4 [Thamnophis sirtalis]